MTFRIKLNPEGRDFFKGVLPSMERNFQGGVRAALQQVGFNLVKTARDGIQHETKTGRVYKRRGRRDHRASAAGQYPANDTGETIKGIDYEIRGSAQVEFGIRERQTGIKDVPKFLEEGTSKMKPRPTLALSFAAREKDVFNYLQRIPHERISKK